MAAASGESLALIPLPKSVQTSSVQGGQSKAVAFRPAYFPMASCTIEVSGSPSQAKKERQYVERLLTSWFPVPAQASEKMPPLILKITGEKKVSPEAYKLVISPEGQVSIESDGLNGAIYALATLKQLKETNAQGQIPCDLVIEDAPRFAHRGFMLDSSRHLQSVGKIKQILDRMAQLKLNVFHWHLTDDYGWRLPISGHPKLTQVGAYIDKTGVRQEMNGFYSREQIKEVLEYARSRGIKIIPEIDVPGHSAALTAVYPQFLCPPARRLKPITESLTAKDPNSVLCLSNKELVPFLEKVIVEVASLFETDTVHMGGDEAKDQFWRECPNCSKLMENAKTTAAEAQREWFLNLSQRVSKRGIRTICWVEEAEKGLPAGMTAQAWRYEPPHRKEHTAAAANAGLPTLCSVGSQHGYAYFDFPGYTGSPKPKWMPVLPLEQVYQYDIPWDQIKEANRHLVLGGEAALWTENVLEAHIDKMIYPRLFAAAEKLWSPQESKNFEGFKARLAPLQKAWEEGNSVQEGGGKVIFERPYSKETIALSLPCKIETTLGERPTRYAEYAFDGDDTTFYISGRPPKAGDTFTLLFDKPVSMGRVVFITGCFYCIDETEGQLQEGVVEVSLDGTNFRPLESLNAPKDGIYRATLKTAGQAPIKALRLRCLKDQEKPLVISNIILKKNKK